jgi:hypothetical protein
MCYNLSGSVVKPDMPRYRKRGEIDSGYRVAVLVGYEGVPVETGIASAATGSYDGGSADSQELASTDRV